MLRFIHYSATENKSYPLNISALGSHLISASFFLFETSSWPCCVATQEEVRPPWWMRWGLRRLQRSNRRVTRNSFELFLSGVCCHVFLRHILLYLFNHTANTSVLYLCIPAHRNWLTLPSPSCVTQQSTNTCRFVSDPEAVVTISLRFVLQMCRRFGFFTSFECVV